MRGADYAELLPRVAEIVGEYCKKGRPLFVEGRLQLDTWEDKQSGQKRSKLKVVGENIQHPDHLAEY